MQRERAWAANTQNNKFRLSRSYIAPDWGCVLCRSDWSGGGAKEGLRLQIADLSQEGSKVRQVKGGEDDGGALLLCHGPNSPLSKRCGCRTGWCTWQFTYTRTYFPYVQSLMHGHLYVSCSSAFILRLCGLFYGTTFCKVFGNNVRSIWALASDLLACEIDVLVAVGSEVGIFSITGPLDFDSANITYTCQRHKR